MDDERGNGAGIDLVAKILVVSGVVVADPQSRRAILYLKE